MSKNGKSRACHATLGTLIGAVVALVLATAPSIGAAVCLSRHQQKSKQR